MKKRQNFLILLIIVFWGMFPSAYRVAMAQRGHFAIGGEYCLLILPFVISSLLTTLADITKDANSRGAE